MMLAPPSLYCLSTLKAGGVAQHDEPLLDL